MPWIDGNTGKPLTDDEETDIEHPWYAHFRQPVTDIGAKMADAALGGYTRNPMPHAPSATAQEISHLVVPQTPVQAGIQAATIPMGIGERAIARYGAEGVPAAVKFLAGNPVGRTLLAGGGGAVGAAAGGGDTTGGFGEGVTSQLIAEPAAGITGMVGRALGKRALLRGDTKNIVDSIGDALGVKYLDSNNAERMLVRGDIVRRAGANTKRAAEARIFADIFDPAKGVYDNSTGFIDQPKLVAELQKSWPQLVKTFGPDKAEAIFDAAIRHQPAMPGLRIADRPSEAPGVHWRPPIHVGVRPPRTYGPVGTVPIWMSPPRAPFSIMASRLLKPTKLGEPTPGGTP